MPPARGERPSVAIPGAGTVTAPHGTPRLAAYDQATSTARIPNVYSDRMPLITCPDCQTQISDAAPACPKCGRPAQARQTNAGTATEERVLFEDKTVTVTNVRTVIEGKTTYAMSNVTSVREFVQPKPAGLLVFGVLLVAMGASCVHLDWADSAQMGWIGNAIGGLLLIAYSLSKPKYWLRIGTAGAETNAIWSHDSAWVQEVVAAMNGAIVSRG